MVHYGTLEVPVPYCYPRMALPRNPASISESYVLAVDIRKRLLALVPFSNYLVYLIREESSEEVPTIPLTAAACADVHEKTTRNKQNQIITKIAWASEDREFWIQPKTITQKRKPGLMDLDIRAFLNMNT
jgi:hypothetical protein